MIGSSVVKIRPGKKFAGLYRPHRYKILYGGRGGGKSWEIARALVIQAYTQKKLILCGREFQNSIADSVHRLITTQIEKMGLLEWFEVTQKTIVSKTYGSEFIFKGLQRSIDEIKSTEGIDIAWVEEAQNTSERSWETLIPTIRKEESEIWLSFNPKFESDPTHRRFVLDPPPGAFIQKINWSDNPHFPSVLNDERLYLLKRDPDAYRHVWEGECITNSEAQVLFGKYEVSVFDDPDVGTRIYYGADFGFSKDPSTLIRLWTHEDCLYISHEAYGLHIELDDLPPFYAQVPGSKEGLIKGDCSRPETISHIKRKGYNIVSAEKWPGSVKDGIAVLRGFKRIYIHERCKRTIEEAVLWRYKVDKKTDEILSEVEDKHNHCWDAVRYALDTYIKQHNFFDDVSYLDFPE